jgi:hypothetical protein
MKQAYRNKTFREEALKKIVLCNRIIEQYQTQGLRLTLRQLYYQLVTQNVIKNEEKSYKNLGSLVSDARLAGLIDWNAIEDRVRQPRAAAEFTGLKDLVDAALKAYRLPRWMNQNNYVELWVEKDALAGVLWPIASQWHVTLMVNRGYSSQSAMYEAAQRYKEYEDREPVLLYLGDHDPSGEDMVRDIRDRLIMFGIEDITVKKVALTYEQVEEYNPPPNPTKLSDSRAPAYVSKYGDNSWEVDALPPEVLQQLITSAIEQYADVSMINAVKDKEQRDKYQLVRIVESIKDA